VGAMTMALLSQIWPYDGHLCRVSLVVSMRGQTFHMA
jgi:hypothetical protein